MIQILEYIVSHYAWFLGGAILVLLAIVGYYADKTNFGQGKNIELEKDKSKDITNMRLSETIGEAQKENDVIKKDESMQNNILDSKKTEDNSLLDITQPQKVENASNSDASVKENFEKREVAANQVINVAVTEQKNNEKTAEEVALENFNKEFDSLLPKKELIATDLLNDIDELSFERTQKINLAELPDLDDIELPEIKNLVNEEQDVWKF